MKQVRVVLIGDAGVGKTSIIKYYQSKAFEKSVATVGADFFKVQVESDEGPVELTVVDTAGATKYRDLIPMYLSNVNVCVLVFSYDNINSLENLLQWQSYVIETRKNFCQFIVVGNKIDIKPKTEDEKVESVLAKIDSLRNIDTSALTGQNIEDLFNYISGSPDIPSSYDYDPIQLHENKSSHNDCC